MAFTPTLILPLPPTPDPIYANLWTQSDDDNTTQSSNTSAFDTGINVHDEKACILCGLYDFRALDHCHIMDVNTVIFTL